MKPAAIGVRMHSGWGVLVAVASEDGKPRVIARERIEVVDEKAGGRRQPYHHASILPMEAAERYLARCAAESQELAQESLRGVIGDLQTRGYRLAKCAVLMASGKKLPPLARILTAHPLIHTAEGEFFRNSVRAACENMKIAVSAVRERNIEEEAKTALGKTSGVTKQIASAGKALGPPWTQEHKKAALAAWMALMSG
jgi:hypothetical protein